MIGIDYRLIVCVRVNKCSVSNIDDSDSFFNRLKSPLPSQLNPSIDSIVYQPIIVAVSHYLSMLVVRR